MADCRHIGKIGQTIVQELRRLARLEHRSLTRIQKHGRVLPKRLSVTLPCPREHQINAAPSDVMPRARRKPQQAGLGASLGPHTKQFLETPGAPWTGAHSKFFASA